MSNRLYVLIQNHDNGRWFGLDRCYRLLVHRGTRSLASALLKEYSRETDHGQTERGWFPTEIEQAPKWAWFRCAVSRGVRFTAYWFSDTGIAIGGFVEGFNAGRTDNQCEVAHGRELDR